MSDDPEVRPSTDLPFDNTRAQPHRAARVVTGAEQPGSVWPLEGSFRCGDGFLVTPDCLGYTFRSRMTSHNVSITVPDIKRDVDAGWLARPPWKFIRAGEDRNVVPPEGQDWGGIAGTKDAPRYAYILQCVVHSEVSADSEDRFKSAAEKFGDELAAWWASVCDWLDVLTWQDFVSLGRAQRSILNDSVQMWSGNSAGIRMAGVNYQVWKGGMHSVEVLDKQQLQGAMDLAASGMTPQAEWLFIRDARSLLNAGEHRRAVIDACTAAELAVTVLIDRQFNMDGTSQNDRDQQFRDHHGLSKLIQLNNSLRASKLPRRLQQAVAEPRNRAAHQGAMSSEAESRAAILKAAEVVDMAYPLRSLAPGIAAGVFRSSPQVGILPQEQTLHLTRGSGLSLKVSTQRP